MHDGSTDQYTIIERCLISLMIGFAFALGYALYELDAVAKNLEFESGRHRHHRRLGLLMLPPGLLCAPAVTRAPARPT